MVYMNCLRENASTSSSCRLLSREYLDCRMDKGLMERDDWKNLGLANLDAAVPGSHNRMDNSLK